MADKEFRRHGRRSGLRGTVDFPATASPSATVRQSTRRARRGRSPSSPSTCPGTMTVTAVLTGKRASISRSKLASGCRPAGGADSMGGNPVASQRHVAPVEGNCLRATPTSTPGATSTQGVPPCAPNNTGRANNSATEATSNKRSNNSHHSSSRNCRRGRKRADSQRRAAKSVGRDSDCRSRCSSSGNSNAASAARPIGSSSPRLMRIPAWPARRAPGTGGATVRPAAGRGSIRHGECRWSPIARPAPRAPP